MDKKIQTLTVYPDEIFHIDILVDNNSLDSPNATIICKRNILQCTEKYNFNGWMWYLFKIHKTGEHGISIIHFHGNDHYIIQCLARPSIASTTKKRLIK